MPGWKRLPLALALVLACIVGGGTGGWAEEHGTRVAIIEMVRILDEASALRSIRSQGEAQRQAYVEDTQREGERLRGMQQELIRQETLLAPEALEQRRRAFNAEVAAAEQQSQARNRLLQRAVQEGEIRFRRALDTVVAEAAKRQDFELVLPVRESLFAVAEFNLTDLVLDRLNEAFPEIVLTFDGN
jgi:Skp family chaperone for outer membrane proteins